MVLKRGFYTFTTWEISVCFFLKPLQCGRRYAMRLCFYIVLYSFVQWVGFLLRSYSSTSEIFLEYDSTVFEFDW